jgi:flagellar basal body-associated protein FliL
MTQHTEETKFVKESEDKTQQFILQKNKKTKLGITILVVFLVVLIIGIVISNMFFNN